MAGPVVMSPRSVSAAVRAELARVNKSDSSLGLAALALAKRLDEGDDPGSAMAAMAKELRVVMNELLARAPAVADPVDELRKRRERRLSG